MEAVEAIFVSLGRWLSVEPRKPMVEPRWTEIYVNESEAAGMSADEALEGSHSVVTIADVASIAECALLRQAAIAAADRAATDRRDGPSHDQQGLRHDGKEGRIRGKVVDLVGGDAQLLCDLILMRAAETISERLPLLMPRLFGTGCLATSILFNTKLSFSPGEPALNVYTHLPGGVNGGFNAHEDKQSLTLLVPLSTCRDSAGAVVDGDFDGGGTAFWTRRDSNARMERLNGEPTANINDVANSPQQDPKVVLQPPPGTAIVFGGDLTHAGQPVLGGQRCVLVASFSAREKMAGTDPGMSDSLAF